MSARDKMAWEENYGQMAQDYESEQNERRSKMTELKGTIQVKAGNGKGFMVNGTEGWFNCADTTILARFNKGDEVIVSYELNGKIKKVSMISSNGPKESLPAPVAQKAPEPVKQEPPVTTKLPEFACEVCGKQLKDGKFKKCYDCNVAKKSAPQPSQEPTTAIGPKCIDCGVALKDDKYTKCFPCNQKNPVKKQWTGKSKGSYIDSPEKTAQIQKGNSLNAAASVLCGASCLDGQTPEAIAEITKVVANSLLDYLKQD